MVGVKTLMFVLYIKLSGTCNFARHAKIYLDSIDFKMGIPVLYDNNQKYILKLN